MDTTDKASKTSTDPSKVGRSASVGFLDLPDGIRNKIYERVLVMLHPLFLFQERGFPVTNFAPGQPLHWSALLYTNRQISIEASAALYRVNRFELIDVSPQLGVLQSFLGCIGSVNAASLSYICISLLTALSIDEDSCKVRLGDDGLQCLKLLQGQCTSLSTLETVVHYKKFWFLLEVRSIPPRSLCNHRDAVQGHALSSKDHRPIRSPGWNSYLFCKRHDATSWMVSHVSQWTMLEYWSQLPGQLIRDRPVSRLQDWENMKELTD